MKFQSILKQKSYPKMKLKISTCSKRNQTTVFFHQRRNILTPARNENKKEPKKNFRQNTNSRRQSEKRNSTKPEPRGEKREAANKNKDLQFLFVLCFVYFLFLSTFLFFNSNFGNKNKLNEIKVVVCVSFSLSKVAKKNCCNPKKQYNIGNSSFVSLKFTA